jgi:hypothetical protein
MYGKNEAYSFGLVRKIRFLRSQSLFFKIKLYYILKSDRYIMKADLYYQQFKYALKKGIRSIICLWMLSFGAALIAQDLPPGLTKSASEANDSKGQKSVSSISTATTQVTKEKTEKYDSGYGSRFCIFAALRPRLTYYEISLFSSFKSGRCSDLEYEKLTEASIMAQLKTFLDPQRVMKLGFHTNVSSENLTPRVDPYLDIGATKFDYVSTIKINYADYLYVYLTNKKFRLGVVQGAYVPQSTRGPLHFIYNPGSTVYELTSPNGKVYIMTSFSTLFNRELTLSNLSELDSLLSLPPGWKFRSRVTDKMISIDATAPYYYADVLFDNYQNFYVEVRP